MDSQSPNPVVDRLAEEAAVLHPDQSSAPAVERLAKESLLRKTSRALVVPNTKPTFKYQSMMVWVFWAVVAFGLWQLWPSAVLPRPLEVWGALLNLWTNEGLGERLLISYWVQIKALGLATGISLVLAYAATIAGIRPIVLFISAWRFISLGPLVIFFTLLVSSNGNVLIVGLLVFAISVFYITSMLPIALEVPTEELDHARTLHMNPWRSTWEVIVLGRFDMALDMLRQNAAMGWMMLTMVEGLVRSEGGVGVLLLNELKHFKLAEVAAIIVVLFLVGFAQDLLLQRIRLWIFPYADLERERR